MLIAPHAAVGLELAGQVPSAVVVPVFVSDSSASRGAGELHVVLTRRRGDLRRHAGEIAFPGGRRDPEDADLCATALREAEEEIGLAPGDVTLLGGLTPTSTFVTNYAIHPFVGALASGRQWKLSAREVDAVIELPVGDLRGARGQTEIERRGIRFHTEAYVIAEHVIWGATARILSDLLDRVDAVCPAP